MHQFFLNLDKIRITSHILYLKKKLIVKISSIFTYYLLYYIKMSELKLLNYLTSSLFSSYEDIEYLESLLEYGKKKLSDDDFQNIINGRFEEIMKPGDTISIRMQPIYLCIIRNKLKSLQLLQKYGVQMVLNKESGNEESGNILLINLAIQYNVDEKFLQYLFGDKRGYYHSLLELPIRRSEMNRVIFLLDYVQITTTELNEYFKIYDREDSKCKYHLSDDVKDEHKKRIVKAYKEIECKRLLHIIRYHNISKNIFKKLPLEIFTLIVSFL